MDFGRFQLAASTGDLADEPAAREHADALEFRLDLAAAPLEALAAYDGALPVIATNRSAAEGGEAPDRPDRLDRLAEAVAQPAVEAVDVELAAVVSGDAGPVFDAAAEHGAATVVSAHDVDGTPDPAEMARTLRRAADAGDLGKLAVTAGDRADVLSVLRVTHELAEAGLAIATMAMGEAGRPSRALAPRFGSRLAYAPVRAADGTAPGQYDLATLAGLLEALGVRRGPPDASED